MKTKPTKACNDFLQYLLNYFNIDKPTKLILEEEIAYPGYDYKGYPTISKPHGTAQPIPFDAPTRYEIKLSLKRHRNKYWLFSTLAHEVGHLVQFENKRYLTPGTDWELEIEATRIVNKPYREYLALHHPKIFNRLGKPLATPEWLVKKMSSPKKEPKYQFVSYQGEIYRAPVFP